ncbi:MAG: PEGA domain-containing protein [Myxococcaceae bacterium]
MLAPLFLVVAAADPKPPPRLDLPAAAAVFAASQDAAAADETGRAELEMVRALRRKTVSLADVDAVFPPPPPASDADGMQLFANGKQAYDNLDTEASAKSLAEAAVWFIKHPEAATPEKLSDIFIFLAAAELQNGNKKDAQKDLVRAIEMNPAAQPDPKFFDASVQKLFEAAKKELQSRAKGTIKVSSDPSGAEVEIGGESRGITPIAPLELPSGRYVVTFTRPGFQRTAAFPEVKENKEADVKQKLVTSPAYQSLRDQAAALITPVNLGATGKPPPGAEDVAKAIKARYLVLVSVAAGAAGPACTAYVWDVNTGNRLNDVTFALDADGEGALKAADKIREWMNMVSALPPPTVVAEEKPSAGGPVYKQWWFWAGAGAVVAIAGGVTAGVLASQPHDQGFNVLLARP